MATKPRCPSCDADLPPLSAETKPHRPFCSERCKWVDLGKWLGEEYRVAALEDPYDPDDEIR